MVESYCKKKILYMLLAVMITISMLPVEAFADEATKLEVSSVRIGHSMLSFNISGAAREQTATACIADKNENPIMEIPFNITANTMDVSLSFPDGKTLPSERYMLTVKSSDGQVTDSKECTVSEHIFWGKAEAYPKKMIIETDDDNNILYATVGFNDYTAVKDASGKYVIEYPTQAKGTKITLHWEDIGGCSDTYTYNVSEGKDLGISPKVFRDTLSVSYSSYSNTYRAAVQIGDKTYYSEYGLSYSDKPKAIITYPTIDSKISEVNFWMENMETGAISDKRTIKIESCKLNDCFNDDSNSSIYGPTKTTEILKTNRYGQNITKVATIVNGKEYSATVDASGKYVLEYPKKEHGDKMDLIFSDKHGCTYKKSVTIRNSFSNFNLDLRAYSNKAFCKMPTYYTNEEVTLYAQIGSNIYKSNTVITDSRDDRCIKIEYPVQKPDTPITFWVEIESGSTSSKVTQKVENRKYVIKVEKKDARTSSLKGSIDVRTYSSSAMDTVYEGSYRIKAKIGDKEYDATIDGSSFELKYPLQKVGTVINLTFEDVDGYVTTGKVTLENLDTQLKIKSLNSYDKMIMGTATAGAKIKVKVGGKTLSATANNSGAYKINLKKTYKSGTKIKVSVTSAEGYTKSKTITVSKPTGDVDLKSYVYRTSSSVPVKISGAHVGDTVTVTVGGKSYKKKITKSATNQSLLVKTGKHSAGSKIKVVYADKYGTVKDRTSDMVYYGNKIYIGMSEKNALLTTWGRPAHRNYYGFGPIQWVFYSGNTTLYVYVQGGKVTNLQWLD